MVEARRVRRAVAIHNKQQQQRAQKVAGPSKEVSMKNFQTVQAEAAKEVTVARAAMKHQQDELSALRNQLSTLQLSKDALQQAAKTAVLGLQSQVLETQQLHNSASLALSVTKGELHSLSKSNDTLHVAVGQLQQLYK